jgi:disulfide bond formation protein DsbB
MNNMKKTRSVRFSYFLGFIVLLFLMGFVFFLQQHGLIPCPLCILQRMMMIALSVVFFMGMLLPLKKTGNIILGIMGLMVTVAGMLLAARQTWLQYTPPIGQGQCGVSLQYLLSILPITDVAKMIWQGGTECSELGWVFLGMSLAEWSLITFGLFFIFVILQLNRSLK